ncbi:MAG: class I SAM-dependent methyltransferase [Oscillospiraceae bacterium]|jgi:tRNA (adenine22-N1)-methyltransferase|nr:class I SAM-dependent methyltransferase [Oscillospiraceae bacterium]
MKLCERLRMTGELVPPGLCVADIGTDHARLPIWLAERGTAPRVIASDLRTGPLQNAARNVAAAGFCDKIELRRSDGLDSFAPGEVECLLFAGMGGTLIAQLLSRCGWAARPGTIVVAQPMRRARDLRRWLCENGFVIEEETACFDAGRAYAALRAKAGGGARTAGRGAAYPFYGELPHCGHPAARVLLRRERRLAEIRAGALAQAGRGGAELEDLRAALAEEW